MRLDYSFDLILGAADLVGFPKDLTTEYTESTEKAIKDSAISVFSAAKIFSFRTAQAFNF